VEFKPPTKSEQGERAAGESNDVTDRETIKQASMAVGSKHFSSRPSPFNLPTNLHRPRDRCRWRYPIPARSLSPHPTPTNESRSPFPPKGIKNRHKLGFDRPPGHLHMGKNEEEEEDARPVALAGVRRRPREGRGEGLAGNGGGGGWVGGNLLVLSCTRRGGVDRLGPRLRLPPAVSVCLVGFTCFGGREKWEGFDSDRFKYGDSGEGARGRLCCGQG